MAGFKRSLSEVGSRMPPERDGSSASADSYLAWLEDAAGDISPEELREFLAADFFPCEADPPFREALREKLWALVRSSSRRGGPDA